MQDVLIYVGIGINILGDLFTMAYAMKYSYAFFKSKNNPIQTEALKTKWVRLKAVGLGFSFLCVLFSIIGCVI